MPWYFPWSDSIKNRACRYLMQRYLGKFLEQKLSLDQLSVDLYEGKGTIKDVALDVAVINTTLEATGLPIELVDGYVHEISLTIPWGNLLKESTELQISGLELTIQPKRTDEQGPGMNMDCSSMFGSMSMTTSMQLAEEVLKQEPAAAQGGPQGFEGLEMFAQTIESVLTRVKVSFVNTVMRLEHIERGMKNGVALEIKIERVNYFDDSLTDPGSPVDSMTDSDTKSIYEPVAIAHKNFHVIGVELFCDEFMADKLGTTRTNSSIWRTNSMDPSSPSYDLQGPLNSFGTEGGHSTDASASDPVLIAKLTGRQTIRLKIKQVEEVQGPRLELDCQLGSLHVHVSPRQVHMLWELAKGLEANSSTRQRTTSKPMGLDDYQRVESELQQHMTSGLPAHNNSEQYGNMTTHPLDESTSDLFISFGKNSDGATSMESSVSSQYSTSSTNTSRSVGGSSTRYSPGVGYVQNSNTPFQSSIPRQVRKTRKKDSSSQHYNDPQAEVTQYRLRLSFFTAILLHDDPERTPSDGIDPALSSTYKLKEMSKSYFGSIVSLLNSASIGNDLVKLRAEMSKACTKDHIGCIGKPLNIELTQKTSPTLRSFEADLSVGLFEMVEALYDRKNSGSLLLGRDITTPNYSELLVFEQDMSDIQMQMFTSMQNAQSPCLRFTACTIQRHRKRAPRNSHQLAQIDFNLKLGKCHSEIDISIVDRINALLNPKPIFESVLVGVDMSSSMYMSTHPHPMGQTSIFNNALDEGSPSSEKKIDLTIHSSNIKIFLRFPVPDLRDSNPTEKLPWWRKNIHSEILTLDLTEVVLHTVISDLDPGSQFEVQCNEAHGLFQEDASAVPVSFLRVCPDRCADVKQEFNSPRLVIKVCPPKEKSVLEEGSDSEEDSTPDESLNGITPYESLNGIIHIQKKVEPSPFSSKKFIYESEEAISDGMKKMFDTDVRKRLNINVTALDDPVHAFFMLLTLFASDHRRVLMVMPAEKQELLVFQEDALGNSRLTIDLFIPTVKVVLPDKRFTELLYNRFNNDLLLWEPLAPQPISSVTEFSSFPYLQPGVGRMFEHTQRPFVMCKSGLIYDSDDDSDEPLYTIHDGMPADRKAKKSRKNSRGQSKSTVHLTLGKGRLTGFVPTLGSDGTMHAPRGEIMVDIEDVNLVAVTSYNGDDSLRYFSAQANRAILYHKGDSDSQFPEEVDAYKASTPTHIHPTLYLSEPGVPSKLKEPVGQGGDSRDMLSVAVKTTIDRQRNSKHFLVGIGVNGTTLNHRTTVSSQSWISQIIDFFDMKDFPVLGYKMPVCVTELHAHIWNGSIDYRPLHLPLRALVTLGKFSVSSNIVARSPTSLLRFIVDDAALFLSDKCDAQNIDVKKNYVCVLDVDLFELGLTTSSGADEKYPKVDLRASNNVVHVRTCADACQALQRLIVYVAESGDLGPGSVSKLNRSQSTSSSCGSATSSSANLSTSETEQMHTMMSEAMRESSCSSSSRETSPSVVRSTSGGATQVYFVTSPNPGVEGTVAYTLNPATESEIDSLPRQITVNMDSSGDSSYMSDSRAVESPTESQSQGRCRSASHPHDDEFCILADELGTGIASEDGQPVVKKRSPDPIKIIDNHFAMPQGKMDQLRAPDHFPPPVHRYSLREMTLVWQVFGGKDFNVARQPTPHRKDPRKPADRLQQAAGRDAKVCFELRMNKVRMQHEVYPDSREQASRQVLIINDVQVRDKVESSSIKKFLYQYTSEAMPRQTHANMVVVKAVHLRPDPARPTQECKLKVSLLPLRLNVDQDSLYFLKNFFTDVYETVSREASPSSSRVAVPDPACRPGVHRGRDSDPYMSLGAEGGSPPEPHPRELLIKFNEMEIKSKDMTDSEKSEDDAPAVYFKEFIFSPAVLIRFDYEGKGLTNQGALLGVIAGLATLNCSEIRLKKIHHKAGLLGVDRLVQHCIKEWSTDIKYNQVPGIVGGVGPLHSMVQLVQGIRDLFWLPVEQYRRDGRIFRGLQRGANSFTTSTALAFLELTNRLVQTIQHVAEFAYVMVSPTSRTKGDKERRKKHFTQAADIREGVSNAVAVVREGLAGTANEIIRTAVEEHEQKGMTGAVGGVLRQVPPTIVRPILLVTEATSNVLGGIRHQLHPDTWKEDQEKWKDDKSQGH